jgi:peptidylprolyl isomerase
MKTVQNGNSVELHYKGTFPDGEVFDSSWDRGETMNILVGQGQLIKGFESALLGMTEGETKVVNLSADEAYGQVIEEAIISVPKSAFPEGFPFEKGTSVQGQNSAGSPVIARIVKFDDNEVTLDHNHPLAGKDINFEIELVKIEDSETTTQE